MKNVYELRNEFELKEWRTAITREDFEAAFYKTKEKITFTLNGWDGKSYDGESRSGCIYRTNKKGFEDETFVKVGKHLFYIVEESNVLELQTGEYHKEADWFLDVLKKN